jgi:hypothetical protein
MGPKLLFVLGIVAAHGALGAAWVNQEPTLPRAAATHCVNTTAPLPFFERPRELVAMRIAPLTEEQRLP